MAASSESRALKVLQISDTHLHAAADARMRGVTTYATLLRVLEHVQRDRRWPPDLVMATGDIVQDESRAGYERFRMSLEPFGIPVASIPGNHDDPNLMAEILSGGSFQFCGEQRHGPWSLIFLSTFLSGEDAGGLGNARLGGLRKALAAHVGQHVLVAMHHHPLPMGSAWLDGVALRDAAAAACAAALLADCASADPAAWRIQGKNGGEVALLGSMHALRASDYPLPPLVDELYARADVLVMEIDLDDLDLAAEQATLLSAAVLPVDQTLAGVLDPTVYKVAERRAHELGVDIALLDHAEPWFVAITLLDLGMRKIGFEAERGLEQYLVGKAARDHKE